MMGFEADWLMAIRLLMVVAHLGDGHQRRAFNGASKRQ